MVANVVPGEVRLTFLPAQTPGMSPSLTEAPYKLVPEWQSGRADMGCANLSVFSDLFGSLE